MKILYNIDYLPVYGQKNILSLYTSTPKKNGKGLLEGIEMILYPGSKIEVVEVLENGVCQVRTPHYGVDYPIFVDERYLSKSGARDFILPSYEKALEKLRNIPEGTRYIYGANFHLGIPRLLKDFEPKVPLNADETKDWILQGVDCSGLFFEICEGATFRNCSMLHQMGEEIKIDNIKQLRPLDLILTPSHVAIVESSKVLVESAFRFHGVHRSTLTLELIQSQIFKGFRIIRPFFKNVDVFCDLFT